MKLYSITVAPLAFVGFVASHSWTERTRRLAPNGTMIGNPGFERNHHDRADPGFSDTSVVWLIPPNGVSRPAGILPDDKIVREEQRPYVPSTSYTEQYPKLKVAPGDFAALIYTENGHVSRQDQESQNPKPINRGTIYLYGTTQNDLTNYNLVDIHLTWTADGKGGDGKGRLLATRNYDDGQCYEAIPGAGDVEGIVGHRMAALNNDAAVPCQSDVQIPLDTPVGETYTVIWVWDWPTMSERGVAVSPATYYANDSTKGEPFVKTFEIYTSVVDFDIVDPCDEALGEVKGPTCGKSNVDSKKIVQFAQQPAVINAGIKAQMENPFLVQVPQAGFDIKAATAQPYNIPMAKLLGVKTSVNSPLPNDMFIGVQPPKNSPSEQDQPPSPDLSTLPPAPSATSSTEARSILTVTVTVPEATVFVTETRTKTAGADGGPTAIAEAEAPVPTPFMTKRSRTLRSSDVN
ncbi:hypothetical protein B0H66DRAFT_24981 [Apodospora peruviana]|uniref:DUF7492 domain-containing protein n=1 Tax=Apodospora peruviana TaxID=516989 RepID=A0AAE0IQF2_9PEZI|nr:hypothetical protein B0H66DRAFT_24981 [Apodospora peruviana]